MNQRVWWPAIVACVAWGCAADRHRGPDLHAERQLHSAHARANDQVCAGSGNCQIDVKIECPNDVCTGYVDPKVALLVQHEHFPKKITWKLTGEHQRFKFKDATIDLDSSVFSCERPDQDRKSVSCTDLFTVLNKVFEYQLHIVKDDNSSLTIDPWIVNR